jgi:EmrB/QacA subfamily drug resistance transporter
MRRKWWTLAGTSAGLFLLMLDSTVVALALPSIRHDVGASSSGLQWVMNVYLLVITVLVVTAGRLGDMFGRKRLFLAGTVVFALGSALAGAAGDEHVLIAGRILQGIGAASMLPLSLAIVVNVFPPAEQARALGVWAGISAAALAIGPLAGGVLVEIDWRVIFWINLPVAAIAIVVTALSAPESADPGSGRRIDVGGLIALTLGLIAVVLSLIQARVWSGPAVISLIVLGIAAFLTFWRVERRVSEPIVDFSLFRNGPYFGASAAAFALVGSYWSVMFFQSQYLQDVLGHSAVLSGLLILPITAPMVFISPLSGRLIARFGARRLMTVGMGFSVLGLLVLTQVGESSPYALILAGYLPFGIALGLVYAPMSTAAMAAMPPEKVGIASGVLAMDRVMAGTIALAATGALAHALLEGGDSFAASIAGSTWILVALCALGTWLTWAFVRDVPPAPAAEAEPTPPDPLHRHHL